MGKVLITGIAGFTGSHLASYLSDLGLEIYGIDSSLSSFNYRSYAKEAVKIYRADVRKQDVISKIIHSIKPDYLFHLAGLIRNGDLKKLLEINVLGTKNILEVILPLDTKILIPGSASEYGVVPEDKLPITEETHLHPINNYGISKVTQTLIGYQYYINNGVKVYLARVFNIAGPGEPSSLVCSTIAKQMVETLKTHSEPVLYVGNVEAKRDFIDVRDVVRAYWAIMDRGNPGEVYNICSGKAHSVREIINTLQKISDTTFTVKQDPSRIKAADISIQVGENKKIEEQTGWYPTIKFEKTLEDLLEYYR